MSTIPLTPDELLTTTRAVRKRLDLTRPVPLDLVCECIEIALQAPNGDNTQRWHWMVLTDPVQRAGIADLYRRASDEFAASAAEAPIDADRARIRSSAAHLYEHLHEVPVLVIPCLEVTSWPQGSQAGLWGSILPAAWNFMLAARARGLGTAWTGLHLRFEKEAGALLELPETVAQAMMTPVAYYLGSTFGRAPRRPWDEVTHFNRW